MINDNELCLTMVKTDETVLGGTIKSGAFLLLYNLFQGSTSCRFLATESSHSCATLLLPFLLSSEHESPSLLTSILLAIARVRDLGPLLPPFIDTRAHKRRDMFTGLPLPDERALMHVHHE